MDIINGYQLIGELKNDNSGFARWGFAVKNGTEYFIKEFLSPIYPLDGTVLSREQILRKREICDEFENQKRAFYNILNECSTGNIVTIADFFRFENKYYIVTEKIDAAPIEPKDISRMAFDQKLLIIKIILYCVNSLHQHNIVHGDIKPDNILFKKTSGGVYTAKIIDFDSSFLVSDAPMDEELQGDMVYLAPESFLLMLDGETTLSTKIDVFALGILFHQYFCGDLPEFDRSKYDYAFEAVLDGGEVKVSSEIPEFFAGIIGQMIDKDPEKRPTINDIFNSLVSGRLPGEEKSEPKTPTGKVVTAPSEPVKGSRLKIRMGSAHHSTAVSVEPSTSSAEAATHIENEFFKKPDDLL